MRTEKDSVRNLGPGLGKGISGKTQGIRKPLLERVWSVTSWLGARKGTGLFYSIEENIVGKLELQTDFFEFYIPFFDI